MKTKIYPAFFVVALVLSLTTILTVEASKKDRALSAYQVDNSVAVIVWSN